MVVQVRPSRRLAAGGVGSTVKRCRALAIAASRPRKAAREVFHEAYLQNSDALVFYVENVLVNTRFGTAVQEC